MTIEKAARQIADAEEHGEDYASIPIETAKRMLANTVAVEARRLKGCCLDCGRKYGDEFGFPDLFVPHDVWAKISPTGDDGGLLCPSCICRRAAVAGIERVPARFVSGPFYIPEFK